MYACSSKLVNAGMVPKSSSNDGNASNTPKDIDDNIKTPSHPEEIRRLYKKITYDRHFIRKNLTNQNLSNAAKEIPLTSWRKGTTKQYKSYLCR